MEWKSMRILKKTLKRRAMGEHMCAKVFIKREINILSL